MGARKVGVICCKVLFMEQLGGGLDILLEALENKHYVTQHKDT